jgi:hypothetical protein
MERGSSLMTITETTTTATHETEMNTGSTTMTIPETEMNTGSTTDVGVKKLSWLDNMVLEEISDTDDGEKIERTREGYRKRKAGGKGGEKGWKRKETG